MASIESYRKRDGKTYFCVRYRKPDHRMGRKSGFATKRDAKQFLANLEIDLAENTFVPPEAGKMPISSIGATWLDGKRAVMKASSYRSIETAWRVHVKPKWGDRQLASIRHSEVQLWVSSLCEAGKSATVVRRAVGVLSGIYKLAIGDKLVKNNPCDGLQLPKKRPKKRTYLNAKQVMDLANACGNYRALILTLGFCGLRWGEATALTPADLNFDTGRINVNKSATKVGSRVVIDSAKSNNIREVPMPSIVINALKEQAEGKAPDALLFTDNYDGGYVRQQSCGRGHISWFAKALKQCGLPKITVHDLRHSAAAIAIHAGANPKVLQRMLGHASAAMTLDTYADLFDTDLNDVSAKMDAIVANVAR